MTNNFGALDSPPPAPAGGLPSDAEMEQALLDALARAGVEAGAYDRQIAAWLARMGWTAAATVTSWLERAAEQQQ